MSTQFLICVKAAWTEEAMLQNLRFATVGWNFGHQGTPHMLQRNRRIRKQRRSALEWMLMQDTMRMKIGRFESIKGNKSSSLFGYICVVSALLTAMHIFYRTASCTCNHYESSQLAMAFSPLWIDAFISTGMKYLSADAAISPSGMLVQCALVASAGSLVTRSGSFQNSGA